MFMLFSVRSGISITTFVNVIASLAIASSVFVSLVFLLSTWIFFKKYWKHWENKKKRKVVLLTKIALNSID